MNQNKNFGPIILMALFVVTVITQAPVLGGGGGRFEHVPWLTLLRTHGASRTRLIDAVAEQQKQSLVLSEDTGYPFSPFDIRTTGPTWLQKEKSESLIRPLALKVRPGCYALTV